MPGPSYVPNDAVDITTEGAVANPGDPDDGSPSTNRDAIIAAANTAGRGGSIYVPSGTFYYGRTNDSAWIKPGVDCANGISIYGAGPEKSTLAITEHTPANDIATMFRYAENDYTSTSITVNIRGLSLTATRQIWRTI